MNCKKNINTEKYEDIESYILSNCDCKYCENYIQENKKKIRDAFILKSANVSIHNLKLNSKMIAKIEVEIFKKSLY